MSKKKNTKIESIRRINLHDYLMRTILIELGNPSRDFDKIFMGLSPKITSEVEESMEECLKKVLKFFNETGRAADLLYDDKGKK